MRQSRLHSYAYWHFGHGTGTKFSNHRSPHPRKDHTLVTKNAVPLSRKSLSNILSLQIGLGVIEDKTCTADQVTGGSIVDGTVVLEKVVKTSPRIDRTGMVESHG